MQNARFIEGTSAFIFGKDREIMTAKRKTITQNNSLLIYLSIRQQRSICLYGNNDDNAFCFPTTEIL